MKKWVILFALLLAVPVMADDLGTVGYIGGIYDSDAGMSLMIGGVTPITGRLYALGHINPSRHGELETNLAFFLLDKPGGKWYIATVAGPNVDWDNKQGEDAITYLVGAAGVLVGYKPVGVGCSYKFSVEEDNIYQDGWRIAAWVSFKFTTP